MVRKVNEPSIQVDNLTIFNHCTLSLSPSSLREESVFTCLLSCTVGGVNRVQLIQRVTQAERTSKRCLFNRTQLPESRVECLSSSSSLASLVMVAK